MRRVPPFHPPLFALYPPLSLYAANVALIPLSDLWVPAAASAFVALILWAALALLLQDGARSAAAASVMTFAFFLYGPAEEAVRAVMPAKIGETPPGVVLAAWILPTAAATLAAGWKTRVTPSITAFLNVTGTAMCLLAAGSVVSTHVAIGKQLATARKAELPGTRTPESGRLGERPDIFFIVLDGFGRSDVLARDYGLPQGLLVSDLAARGFVVATESNANYCQTQLSLAATLNMDWVQRFVSPMGDPDTERLLLDKLIDESRVSKTLKRLGYRFITVGTGFPALTFPSADVSIEGDTGKSLFLDALLKKTPIRSGSLGMRSMYDERREQVLGGFGQLRRLAAKTPSPRFVFAHILAPHPPFVFGPNGEPIHPRGPFTLADGNHFLEQGRTRSEYLQGYAGQATYISRLVVETVDRLLDTPDPKPVIIVQGDHGPKLRLHQESLDQTEPNEVFPILSAFYVPREVGRALYPSITPINTFRVILGELFDLDLPLLDDRSYYSPWTKPLQFTEVTASLRRTDATGSAPTR